MPDTSRTIRQQRRASGHRPVRHGDGDWRCACGLGLSTTFYDYNSETYYVSRGRRAARIAMMDHRNQLWMDSPEGQQELAEALARIA